MKKKILDVEYEFNKCSFGQFLEAKHESTEVDVNIPLLDGEGKFSGQYYEKLNDAKFTRKLGQMMVKKEGKPVDINNAKDCPFEYGAQISLELGRIIKELNKESKNSLGGQEKV